MVVFGEQPDDEPRQEGDDHESLQRTGYASAGQPLLNPSPVDPKYSNENGERLKGEGIIGAKPFHDEARVECNDGVWFSQTLLVNYIDPRAELMGTVVPTRIAGAIFWISALS